MTGATPSQFALFGTSLSKRWESSKTVAGPYLFRLSSRCFDRATRKSELCQEPAPHEQGHHRTTIGKSPKWSDACWCGCFISDVLLVGSVAGSNSHPSIGSATAPVAKLPARTAVKIKLEIFFMFHHRFAKFAFERSIFTNAALWTRFSKRHRAFSGMEG